MDTQHNHSPNLDPQETLAQEYALREHQQSNNKVPSNKRGPGFGMGMLAGMLSTLLIVMAVTVGGRIALSRGNTATAERSEDQQQEQKDTDSLKNAIAQKDVKEKAAELADLIDQYYYEKIDQDALVEGMYAGMVEGLGDPYSAYFSAEEFTSFNESTTGVYYGIGTVLTQNVDTKVVMILHVYPGTPAEEAGLKDGDVIVKVEDIEADSVELSELTSHIKGEEGTKVHLEIMRAGEQENLGFRVQRKQI